MQGTPESGTDRGLLSWPWILVGITLGLLLSTYGVFVGRALSGLQPLQILITYCVSFLITGFFVGFLSPGVTLIEPALAGGGLVPIDAVLAAVGFDAPFPAAGIGIAVIVALVLALPGGWVGEVLQRSRVSAAVRARAG